MGPRTGPSLNRLSVSGEIPDGNLAATSAEFLVFWSQKRSWRSCKVRPTQLLEKSENNMHHLKRNDPSIQPFSLKEFMSNYIPLSVVGIVLLTGQSLPLRNKGLKREVHQIDHTFA